MTTLMRLTLQVAIDTEHAPHPDPVEAQADAVEAIVAAADLAVPWARIIGAVERDGPG